MDKWKETAMITTMALAILLLTGVAKADTTPANFLSTLASIPGKVIAHVKSEAEDIKQYQSQNWSEMKTKWPFKQNSSK
jgi:hypothetical protein